MKPKISSIYESIFSSYKIVRITDENEHEFFLNFPLNAEEKEIRQTWENESCWNVI